MSALVLVHRGRWTDAAADAALEASGLSARDRAFAAALLFGSVERMVTLDWLLAPLLAKPLEKLDAEVRGILEAGLYQLLYMRVPARAAVDESVKLARAMGKASAAGLVNAVLRRAAAAPWAAGEAGPDFSAFRFESEAERVQVCYSLGAAVANAVMEALPGEYEDFLAASFAVPGQLCLRANTLSGTREALIEELREGGAKAREGSLPQAIYASLPGGLAAQPLFAAGRYHVQGEASQYACACLGAVPGLRVLDLCAAPGGKSATLAEMMGGGAGLTACDAAAARLPMITETLARLGITGAQVCQNDATVYDAGLCGQSRVLCDVPCSSLGVLAQKPDLRFSTGARFAALPDLQLKILATGARYVEKGGRLVYSTCTLRRQENQDVVANFLRENGNFRLTAPQNAPKGALLEEGMLTLLPHRCGMDGFFVAIMERI